MADEIFDAEEYAKEWLSFAEMDLSSAEFLLEKRPVPLEIICYLCQQSAEKCLKGLLVLKKQTPPKTHDLYWLLDLCRTYYSEVDSINSQCAALNSFSSQPRYPRESEITEQSMVAAIENAKAVYAYTEPFVI
jgi:HEPN domain-containing protein